MQMSNMIISVLVFWTAFILASNAFATVNSTSPTIKTLNGTYAGRHLPGWEQDVFLGIPYARPPVGPLRFKWPQSIDSSFEGVREASQYGYSCYQYNSNFNLSEDCLTINGNTTVLIVRISY